MKGWLHDNVTSERATYVAQLLGVPQAQDLAEISLGSKKVIQPESDPQCVPDSIVIIAAPHYTSGEKSR